MISSMEKRIVLMLLISPLIVCILVNGDGITNVGPVRRDVDRPDGLCALLVLTVPGYGCREYVVQTEDQFLLGLQRVSKLGYTGQPKGPVLLLHGILNGGDVWLLNPPDNALPFILANEGFDVWIANTRTTRFSYGHVYYTKKDKAYWDWSVDELAQYDLLAMLGLARSETNQKVHFVGFSQGTQQAFVAFAEGYNLMDMVAKMVFLAPVAYCNDPSSPIAQLGASFYVDRLYSVFHVYEFSTSLRQREFVDIVCRGRQAGCFKGWYNLFTGDNCCLNASRRAIINAYETQSTATKNVQHLGQQYRQQTFAKFDYGFHGNLARYKWPTPPKYDLSKVPTSDNMLFIYAGRDGLASKKDVELLFSLLPSGGNYLTKFVEDYAHLDFLWATNAKDLIYDPVVTFLLS